MKTFSLIVFVFVSMVSFAQVVQSEHDVFDDQGRLAVKIVYTYTDSGIVDTRSLQSFNKQGKLVRIETYTADDDLLFVQKNKYDRKGRLVRSEQTNYSEDGSKTQDAFEYRYMPDGCRYTYLNKKLILDPYNITPSQIK